MLQIVCLMFNYRFHILLCHINIKWNKNKIETTWFSFFHKNCLNDGNKYQDINNKNYLCGMVWLGVKQFNYQFIPHRPLQILFLWETIFQNHIQFVFIVALIVYEWKKHLHICMEIFCWIFLLSFDGAQANTKKKKKNWKYKLKPTTKTE